MMTVDGDQLDLLCFRRYGRWDVVPIVLKANPGLADRGDVLHAGIEIIFPVITEPTRGQVRLWGYK